MNSTRQTRNLIYSGTSLAIVSFFITKIITAMVKATLCYLFDIRMVVSGYWIRPMSPPSSGAYTHFSVLSVSGTELLIPALIFLSSLLIYHRNKLFNQPRTAFAVWMMLTSGILFFSAIVSSVVTYTNVFHFFNWLYLPNHLIMAIGLSAPPLLLWFLQLVKPRLLKLAPADTWLESPSARRKIHLYGFTIPLAIAAIVFYLLAGNHPNRYAAYESGILLLSAIAIAVYTPANTFRKVKAGWMKLNPRVIFIILFLLIITGVLRWVF